MNTSRVWPGHPYPLGATWTGSGVNFALFSEGAEKVELCLFDSADPQVETARLRLLDQTDGVWHGFLPDARPGQLYGYRVHGPYEPERGLRYNPAKLLIDPYAKAIAGRIQWSDEMFGYQLGGPMEDLARDDRDDAGGKPRAVVVDPAFDWGAEVAPRRKLHEMVIYEAHVRGFSKMCTKLPEELRGTYAGLGSPEAVAYFQKLGITAVELLPVHQHVEDKHLVDRGLVNYWGYNTIGFFAPECAYASAGERGGQVAEFKQMVKNLHAAGIEVILDVVYNHTAEGNHLGPTISFRGIDNLSYYRTVANAPRYYMDYTGCGNTLNATNPRVLQLIMDSLRYWVTEMHVDGFRFDLASALARELHEFHKLSGFFDVIHQDPIISQVKLIAEPWDIGEGGYQVGNFPVLWAEWNGRYRDCVRRFWKGDEGLAGELAMRLTGSSDLYEASSKRPYASINFVTAHDGFTLADLVSYNERHNEANGEGNRDGESHNNSWNCGAEGPTEDAGINILRRRQQRNMLATLMLSQGVPMLLGGDEYGRTQRGNNNAYCQDNDLSWHAWERSEDAQRLMHFASWLIHFRRDHPIFHRSHFFQGRSIRGSDIKDIMWLNKEGKEMADEEWNSGSTRSFAVLLSGDDTGERDDYGEPIHDDTFLLLLNAHYEPVKFVLPNTATMCWDLLLATELETGALPSPRRSKAGVKVRMVERSLRLYQACQPGERRKRRTYA